MARIQYTLLSLFPSSASIPFYPPPPFFLHLFSGESMKIKLWQDFCDCQNIPKMALRLSLCFLPTAFLLLLLLLALFCHNIFISSLKRSFMPLCVAINLAKHSNSSRLSRVAITLSLLPLSSKTPKPTYPLRLFFLYASRGFPTLRSMSIFLFFHFCICSWMPF